MKHIVALHIFLVSFLFTQAQTTVLQENFNSGIPGAWTLINNDGFTPFNDPSVNFVTDAWVAAAAMEQDSVNDLNIYSTSWYSPAGKADDWIITPQITLGAFGNYLYWQARSEDASYPDGYMVLTSKTGNQIADFTDTLFITGGEVPEWQDREVSLDSAGLTGEMIYLAFVNNSNDRFLLLLDNIKVEIDNPVSVKENTLPQLSVFPNPASERLFIHTSQKLSIEIFDLSGRLIHTCVADSYTTSVDISTWSKGMYLVKSVGQSKAQKLIVQ